MDSVSGTSICTYLMCCRFQMGSKIPFANRNARMLSTDSLPRKWSILNTCDSSNTLCTASFSSLAEARSQPNGFSTITRELGEASPDAPSIATTDSNADGGIARGNSRPLAPPLGGVGVPVRLAVAVPVGDGLLRRGDRAHQRRRVLRGRRGERQVRDELLPRLPARLRPPELVAGRPRVLPELVLGHRELGRRGPAHRELVRQQPRDEQVVEPRQ